MATVGDQAPPGDDAVWVAIRALQDKQAQTQAQAANASAIASSIHAIQVQPLVGEASNSNFASTSGYTTFASFNFTVPAGFTRGLISASGFTNLNTSNSGSDQNWTRVLINGAAGPESSSLILGPGGPSSAFHVASLTGLTGGQTISVAVQAHIQTGSNVSLFQQWNCATITATGLFLT